MNQFPYPAAPGFTQTGIYTQQIELIDTQVYAIEIGENWISHKPQDTPLLSLLSYLGQGDMINVFMYTWWDEYEGNRLIDSGIYNLRTRDGLGNAVSNPSPWVIGADGEIGGKIMWQKSYITSSSVHYTNQWDTYLADACTVVIRTPLTISTYTAASTNMVPVDALGTVCEIQDTCPQLVGSKKLVSLAFNRPATGKWAYITGNVLVYINQMRSSLLANGYVLESFAGCTWNGTGSKTIYSIKHTTGSLAVMHSYDNLETIEWTDHDTGIQEQMNIVNVKIDRFIFSEDGNSFILVLDFARSNEEFTANAAVLASAIDASGYDGWWMCTKSTSGGESSLNTSSPVIYPGDIFRFNQGVDVWAAGTGTNEFVKVETALLIEQTNTAVEWTSTTTWNATDRMFGLNRGSVAGVISGGSSSLNKYLVIDMFHDTGTANSEDEGFGVEEQTGYTFTQEGKYNWLEIMNTKPYGITTMRQGMKLGFAGHGKDNFAVLREREMTKNKRIWQNKCIWGKKSNTSSGTTMSTYKGTMSGLMDFEMFGGIHHAQIPLPVLNKNILVYSDGGLGFQIWLEKIAKVLNYNASTGKYDGAGRTCFISLTIRNYIRTTMAFLASSHSSNILGANYTMTKGSDTSATLGMDTDAFDTSFGKLTFVYMPELDKDTKWPMPRHLYSHRNGLVSPKWMIIGIDKASIKLKTHQSRPDRIYGNLQPSNNPFVYKEGMSGAHTLEVRNDANHGFIDATPNNM